MAEILVVGLSARALAQSARSAGHLPLAADLFCDLDLQESADRSVRIESDLRRGLEWEPLIEALDTLADGRRPEGIVCGSGFEDRPNTLDRLAERWRLLGNDGATVARVKDPASLSATCERLGIPHPRWSGTPRRGWLRKQVGGAGGAHIGLSADVRDDPAPNFSQQGGAEYWQEHFSGEAVAALVLGSGKEALVLGFSSQWSDPAPGARFRYGGAVRPAGLEPVRLAELADAARALARGCGLIGLNSIDFLVGADGWRLVEVNPRPGATLDIFRPTGGSAFELHIGACNGELPAETPTFEGASAQAIVYAGRSLSSFPPFDWPDWSADRQPPGGPLEAGAPVCTVLAEADNPAAARRLVEKRGRAILAELGAA